MPALVPVLQTEQWIKQTKSVGFYGETKINKIKWAKGIRRIRIYRKAGCKCGHGVEIFDEHAKEILTDDALDSRPEENGKWILQISNGTCSIKVIGRCVIPGRQELAWHIQGTVRSQRGQGGRNRERGRAWGVSKEAAESCRLRLFRCREGLIDFP